MTIEFLQKIEKIKSLLNILEKESENAINRFKIKEMTDNTDKFQVMIVSGRKKVETMKLKISDVEFLQRLL